MAHDVLSSLGLTLSSPISRGHSMSSCPLFLGRASRRAQAPKPTNWPRDLLHPVGPISPPPHYLHCYNALYDWLLADIICSRAEITCLVYLLHHPITALSLYRISTAPLPVSLTVPHFAHTLVLSPPLPFDFMLSSLILLYLPSHLSFVTPNVSRALQ